VQVPTGWAIEANKGNNVRAKSLIVQHPGTDYLDERWNTPFLWAASNGYTDLVELLISKGVEINQKNELTGETALIFASKGGHNKTVSLLINNNADITIRDNVGKTALEWAATKGNKIIVRQLLAASDKVSLEYNGHNPLVSAVYSKDLSTVKYLVANNFRINENDDYGETPLIVAAKLGNPDLTRYLLDAGADPIIADREGRTSLMWAAQSKDINVTKMILNVDSDINRRSKAGYTAFMLATISGHEEMMEFLIKRGANPHFKDRRGNNIAYLAALSGNPNVLGTLLKVNIDPAATSENIRKNNPFVTAPMFNWSGVFSVNNNDKNAALKYFAMAQEDYVRMSKKFSSIADEEASERRWKIFRKIFSAALSGVAQQMQGEIVAKQRAEYSALAQSNSLSQYYHNYNTLKAGYVKAARAQPAIVGNSSGNSIGQNVSINWRIKSEIREFNFRKMAENALKIASDFNGIIACIHTRTTDYSACQPQSRYLGQ
jgi:ankyrin repeat protein